MPLVICHASEALATFYTPYVIIPFALLSHPTQCSIVSEWIVRSLCQSSGGRLQCFCAFLLYSPSCCLELLLLDLNIAQQHTNIPLYQQSLPSLSPNQIILQPNQITY